MGLSIWHILALLVVVILVFGTKKLGNVGSDLGKAIKGFKDGVKGDDEPSTPKQVTDQNTVDAETKDKAKH